jgi:hypothetical protein
MASFVFTNLSTHSLHFDYWHGADKNIKIIIHLEWKVCTIELKRQLAGEKIKFFFQTLKDCD